MYNNTSKGSGMIMRKNTFQISRTNFHYHFTNKTLKQLNRKYGDLPGLSYVLQCFDRSPNQDYFILFKNMKNLSYCYAPSSFQKMKTEVEQDGNIYLNYSISPRLDSNNVYHLFYLLHEYYHIATTIVNPDKKRTDIGFYRKIDTKELGEGLNEGCTQFFVCQDMGLDSLVLPVAKENKIYYINPIGTALCRLLSFVVGKEQLRELYFSNNLQGLIDLLTVYCDGNKKLAVQWVKKMDQLLYLVKEYYQNGFVDYSGLLIPTIEECQQFLIYVFYQKNGNNLLSLSSKKDFDECVIVGLKQGLPITRKEEKNFVLRKIR